MRFYGPDKELEDPRRCIVQVNPRHYSEPYQCRFPRGQGKNGLLCKTHFTRYKRGRSLVIPENFNDIEFIANELNKLLRYLRTRVRTCQETIETELKRIQSAPIYQYHYQKDDPRCVRLISALKKAKEILHKTEQKEVDDDFKSKRFDMWRLR